MERLNNGFMDWMEKHQSRRGFLATLGKVSLGIGLAMAGAAAMPTRVFAAQCCQGPLCGSGGTPACVAGGCGAGCTTGGTYVCCDKGGIGSTGTVHSCQICLCFIQCDCETDTGVVC